MFIEMTLIMNGLKFQPSKGKYQINFNIQLFNFQTRYYPYV